MLTFNSIKYTGSVVKNDEKHSIIDRQQAGSKKGAESGGNL